MENNDRQLSPAARHRERVLAAKRTESDDQSNIQAASEYELKLLELAQDKRDLKLIKAVALKVEKKKELLPKYLPWVQGVIDGNLGIQDDVLVTVLVWAIDTGDFDLALQIGAYCIAHKLAMPDNYSRDVPNIIAEEIADAQLILHTSNQPMSAEIIAKTLDLVKGCDLFDPVKAKLLKAYGYALRDTDKAKALEVLTEALSINDKAGVKKDIEILQRELKNSSGT